MLSRRYVFQCALKFFSCPQLFTKRLCILRLTCVLDKGLLLVVKTSYFTLVRLNYVYNIKITIKVIIFNYNRVKIIYIAWLL